MPDLGQVPKIDLLSYLPDLSRVTDSLMYSADLGLGITPSALSAILELPVFQTEVDVPFKAGELAAGEWMGPGAP